MLYLFQAREPIKLDRKKYQIIKKHIGGKKHVHTFSK